MRNHTEHWNIEKKIHSFKREHLSENVKLAKITLSKGESSTFHYHTLTRDTFYVVSGTLTLFLRIDSRSPKPAFYSLGGVEQESPTTFKLGPGAVFVIEAKVIHCATNLADDLCEFLCIEGYGPYDFVNGAS